MMPPFLSVLKEDENVCITLWKFYSGGPLLDSKGNMIGINTAIFTQTGMSFSHTVY
jgi:hypothetical protein